MDNKVFDVVDTRCNHENKSVFITEYRNTIDEDIDIIDIIIIIIIIKIKITIKCHRTVKI